MTRLDRVRCRSWEEDRVFLKDYRECEGTVDRYAGIISRKCFVSNGDGSDDHPHDDLYDDIWFTASAVPKGNLLGNQKFVQVKLDKKIAYIMLEWPTEGKVE